MKQDSAQQRSSDRLGDFSVSPRVLMIVAIALPIGAMSAGIALLLQALIGLITNLVFYQHWATELVAPGAAPHSPWLILTAPVIGGLIVGLVALEDLLEGRLRDLQEERGPDRILGFGRWLPRARVSGV